MEGKWDTIYRHAMKSLREEGTANTPHKGETTEFLAHKLTLPNARDRCLWGHPVFDALSATGHWLWIMAGRMDLWPIQYYNPTATKFSVDKTRLHGAYGPRLFGIGVYDQINRLIEVIGERESTRRAVAIVYSPEFDSHRKRQGDTEDEVPCTIALQFLPRGDALHAVGMMRSQDAFKLLPLDVFVFTLIQEYVAASVGRRVGTYSHFASSFHYYHRDEPRLTSFLSSSPEVLPPMPAMDPGPQTEHLNRVLQMEEAIRTTTVSLMDHRARFAPTASTFLGEARELPPFWRCVALNLIALAGSKLKDKEVVKRALDEMHPAMVPFTHPRLAKLTLTPPIGFFHDQSKE